MSPFPHQQMKLLQNISLRDTAVSLPADTHADHADADPVKGTQAIGRWTLEEDAKLTSAVANTSKKKWGNEYKIDWVAVAALVSSRTILQCRLKWKDVLDPSIDQATGRTGKWTEEEDIKLKDAVQMHGSNNWGAIATLVLGRTKKNCWERWHNSLNPSITLPAGRRGSWTVLEDNKLKDAVQAHGGKNWGAIAALVPGRTQSQCRNRWHNILDPSIDRTSGRRGKWTSIESTS
jgi:myb proto-oncogene protein